MFLKNIKIKKTLKLRVLSSRILHLERRDYHLSWGPVISHMARTHGGHDWPIRMGPGTRLSVSNHAAPCTGLICACAEKRALLPR